jgi:hypothetical protein
VEVVEDTKMTERRGNVYENKGPVAEFRIMNGELLRSTLVRAAACGARSEFELPHRVQNDTLLRIE